MRNNKAVPELLAPAGHIESLSAAVAAGADAVYFGVGAYNARMNAKNFDNDDLLSALSLCHAHGVKAHVTLNTQLYDRELNDAVKVVSELYDAGVDALIVADLGLAELIHKYFPDLELHASTQAAGHSVRDAEYFASLGFSRIVVARETSYRNLSEICKKSPIDVEMFIHGANCVSFSGQCLMSSLIGGRSGNRGECAQPCRLSYNGSYPLSPKDLCLAGHIKEIMDLGVSSLKIEGRMKSPDYVYRVVSIYRKLLDEKRNAGADEIAELSRAFSRSGFTDGFFTGEGKKHPNMMLGIRTEGDKNTTKKTEIEVPAPDPVKIRKIKAEFTADKESTLTLETENRTVTVTGAVPEIAKTKPMSEEYAVSQLSKLGGTHFTANGAKFDVTVSDGVMLPASAINELRRRGISVLTEVKRERAALPETVFVRETYKKTGKTLKTAEFTSPDGITDTAKEYFDLIYLPLECFDGEKAKGVILPPIIYDGEVDKIKKALRDAVLDGVEYCMTANSGQTALLDGLDLKITAGHRYNVNNSLSAKKARETGAEIVTVSPELTIPQARDIAKSVPVAITVYGRIPVMTTERCIVRAAFGDECVCGRKQGTVKKVELKDRMGARFPILSIDGCRNVIYNSVPVYMADRMDKVRECGFAAEHFMFTTENGAEVDGIIESYKKGLPTTDKIRRLK